jgi:hypothetical protein
VAGCAVGDIRTLCQQALDQQELVFRSARDLVSILQDASALGSINSDHVSHAVRTFLEILAQEQKTLGRILSLASDTS